MWYERLRINPLPVLQFNGDPALRYWLRRDVLGEAVEPVAQLWDLPEPTRLLRNLGQSYGRPAWSEAADWFDHSDQELEQLTNSVVDFLLGACDSLDKASASVAKIASLEEQAFRLLSQR